MSYTPEEKDLLKAARKLTDNCHRFENSCRGCLFDTEDGCALDYGLPDDWDILSEEEEEQ